MDVRKVDFPSFLTGLNELNVVDAILESAASGKWVDVKYSVDADGEYL